MTGLITKRNIGGDMAEQQSWPKKPSLVRPLPLRASAKMPFGAGSSFQPWKKPSGDNNNGHGTNAEATTSSNTTKPCHRLATSSNSTTPEENGNNQNIENHSTEKNPTNIDTGATSSAANDDEIDNTANTDEVQPGSGSNTKPEMEPKKLKRYICAIVIYMHRYNCMFGLGYFIFKTMYNQKLLKINDYIFYNNLFQTLRIPL